MMIEIRKGAAEGVINQLKHIDQVDPLIITL